MLGLVNTEGVKVMGYELISPSIMWIGFPSHLIWDGKTLLVSV